MSTIGARALNVINDLFKMRMEVTGKAPSENHSVFKLPSKKSSHRIVADHQRSHGRNARE